MENTTAIPENKSWNDGFKAAMQLMVSGGPDASDAESVKQYRRRVLDAIHDTIREDFGCEPEIIYKNNRGKQTVKLRVFSWEVYQTLTCSNQQETMDAFGGLRSRATFANMKKNFLGTLDYVPEYREDFRRFRHGVQTRMEERSRGTESRYVDLGLPSGTLWADRNLIGYHGAALLNAPQSTLILPTREDFEELIAECTMTWDESLRGMFFTGRNGKSVFLPADGIMSWGKLNRNGAYGEYLMGKSDTDGKNVFKFYRSNVTITDFSMLDLGVLSVSVRPVSKKTDK